MPQINQQLINAIKLFVRRAEMMKANFTVADHPQQFEREK